MINTKDIEIGDLLLYVHNDHTGKNDGSKTAWLVIAQNRAIRAFSELSKAELNDCAGTMDDIDHSIYQVDAHNRGHFELVKRKVSK